MKTSNKRNASIWQRTPKFVYGAVLGTVLGIASIMKLGNGAVVVLAGLVLIAAYAFYLTNQRSFAGVRRQQFAFSPAPVLAVLVIGVMSVAGAHYFNQSFAWHPQGMIKKTVQNVTTGGPVLDANTSTAPGTAKAGDILNYTVTISNIAPNAANQYNDMAYTVLTDTLPNGVELVASPATRTITENIGTILPGKSVVKIYQVRVTANSNGTILENKACFTADSVVRDNKQSGCDLAFLKLENSVVDPKTNDPKYWGANCTKTEFGGNVMSYTAPSGTGKVIVKGGTGYIVYTNAPFTNLTAPINPNNDKPYAISHVIVCPATTTPNPTPTPTPTPNPTPNPTPTPTPNPTATPAATPPASPATTTVSMPTQLPNVGPGNIIMVALFAVVTGYIFHALSGYMAGGAKKTLR